MSEEKVTQDFEDKEKDIDVCLDGCDTPITQEEITADEDLPAAEGGVV